MKKLLLSFLVMLIFTTVNTFADPIEITTEAELLDLMNQNGDFSDWSADYILMSDLDMDEETCNPIGRDNDPFTGTFDGNGYTISNITIDEDGEDYIGLFGYIGSGGVVYDLTLIDVNMTGGDSVGGFAGANLGTVMNCSVSGDVYAYEVAGGFVGENTNSIDNCSSSCNVSAADEGSSYIFGGFVGINSFDLDEL
jgi:hypothetical protein